MVSLNEFSINNLLSRVGSGLASELTRYFSQERRVKYKMGNTPRYTKLVDTFYDKNNDSITFTFLTYATPKPDPNNVEIKQKVDPLNGFRKDINDLQIYDIMLRFFNVSSLMGREEGDYDSKIRKSRAKPKGLFAKAMASRDEPEPEKATEPTIDSNFEDYEAVEAKNDQEEQNSDDEKNSLNLPESVKFREERVSVQSAKDWLFNTNFAIWSNSPSFHWQGFNYNLSQLDASMFPTTIAPKSGKKGWKDKHGNALVDKHLLELFVYIKFFIGQMASSLLNKVRSSRKESYNMVDLLKKGILMSEAKSIKWLESNTVVSFKKDELIGYITEDNTLKYEILDLTHKGDIADYKVNFKETTLSTKHRVQLFEIINSGKEDALTSYTVSDFGKDTDIDSYEEFEDEDYTPELQEKMSSAILRFIEKKNPDIFSINFADITTKSKFLSKVFESLYMVLRDKYVPELIEKGNNKKALCLIKEDKYTIITGTTYKSFTEADDAPENTDMPKPEDDTGLEGGAEPTQGDDAQNQEEEQDKPTKLLVCGISSFSPVTPDHKTYIDCITKVASDNNTVPVILMTNLENFTPDESSFNAKVGLIKKMFPKCKVVGSYDTVTPIEDFFSWATSKEYTDLILVAPSDREGEYYQILFESNGMYTESSRFDFQEYQVINCGQKDPDSERSAYTCRNAVVDNDFETFKRMVYTPSKGYSASERFSMVKLMYKLLKYEADSVGIV